MKIWFFLQYPWKRISLITVQGVNEYLFSIFSLEQPDQTRQAEHEKEYKVNFQARETSLLKEQKESKTRGDKMPCRVGITTDPERRKKEWENKVVGLKNWRILLKTTSRKKAQQKETDYAKEHGCQASPGGSGSGTWYVYYFKYTREK